MNLEGYKLNISKANSERASILEMFVEEINRERLGTKWRPLTKIGIKRLCIAINEHPMLKTNSQLYEFLALCKQAKTFSGKCYGTIKTKRITPSP
jgi:hypothetical protein